MILGAHLLALVGRLPSNLDGVPSAVDAVHLPLIFVGTGLLPFGVGVYRHLLHLNLVDQLQRGKAVEAQSGDGDADH